MRNLKKKTEQGITLIALIVTIIVLIILAVVSINAIFGEDGIIARAELAKTKTEMAQIKEEAEMLKASLKMDVYEGKIEELNKINLVAGLKEHFEGSSLDGEKVVVSNGKYAIVISDNLSIDVIKNGESSGDTGSGDDSGSGDSENGDETGEPGETITITYEISDLDENTKTINLNYSVGDSIEFSELEEDELEVYVAEIYSQRGDVYDEEAKNQMKTEAESWGMTYKEYMVLMLQIYMNAASLEAYKGETKLEVNNSKLIVKENGTYKIVATKFNGARAEIEVEVTGIMEEKFSEIYTASADYVDSLGNKARIPKGFAVGTTEDINSIDKGLVITDSVDENGNSNGNEFVWIPVSNINGDGSNKIKVRNADGTTKQVEITLGRYLFDETDGTATLVQYGSDFEDETGIEEGYSDGTNTWYYKELKIFRESVDSDDTDGLNETAKDLAGFIESVETNGGYFIARYEASYESGNSIENYKLASKVSTTFTTSEDAELTKGRLWNNISQGDLAKVCKNMYTEEGYKYVEADLINSYAWDTAIIFIQNCSNNSNYANADSDITGNDYTENTGFTGDLVCNIYDMAANLEEYTTEYCTFVNVFGSSPSVWRGDNSILGESNTASRGFTRSIMNTYYSDRITGRLLLYNSNSET